MKKKDYPPLIAEWSPYSAYTACPPAPTLDG